MTQRLFLFDLDGTLVDSAPDLAGAMNEMLAARGLPERPLEELREPSGHGGPALLKAAFGMERTDPRFEAMRLLGIAEAGHNLHRDPRVQGAEALENAGNPVDAGAELHAAGGEPRQAADDLRERLIGADDALRVGQKCLPAPINSQPLLPRKNSGTDCSFSILERL